MNNFDSNTTIHEIQVAALKQQLRWYQQAWTDACYNLVSAKTENAIISDRLIRARHTLKLYALSEK